MILLAVIIMDSWTISHFLPFNITKACLDPNRIKKEKFDGIDSDSID